MILLSMEQPLVSILTPFKNTAPYLTECLESVIGQTYRNWELLIVDDHSSDESFEIVQQFANNDNRIKLLKNKNHGIIEALRLALNNSCGQYITRMDSDDVMLPHKLSTMVTSLQHYGKKHLAIGCVKYFGSGGISNGYQRYELWLNNLTNKGANYSEIYKECPVPSPCWMSHREDLLACGAFDHDRYPEDYDLTFRFYKQGLKCIPSDKLLHMWRDYPSRTSRTHPHYAQNYFLDIKLHYFLQLDHDNNRPLTVWGAGFKGKHIAKILKKSNINFTWVCDNPNKIGKAIYGIRLQGFDQLKNLNHPQSVITVANEVAQAEINSYMDTLNLRAMKDYFFFC